MVDFLKKTFLFSQQTVPISSGISSVLMMAFFFLAFWFLLIAPQRKRQRAQEKMIAELKEGDEIITTAGLFGSVLSVKGERLMIKTGDAKLELHKNFVQTKLSSLKKAK